MALLSVSSDIKNKDDKHHPSNIKILSNDKQESLIPSNKGQTILAAHNYQKEKTIIRNLKISGIAFYDNSLTSMYQKSSKGINNIRVCLYDNKNNLISSVLTKNNSDISGYFEFTNLQEGIYKIIISVPYKMRVSNRLPDYEYGSKICPKNNSVTLTLSNSDITNIFIGLQPLLIKTS